MKNYEPRKARMMAAYEKKQMNGNQLESVNGGRGFFNAPDNPTCRNCKSRNTWTTGWMMNWKVHCRDCGSEYWEASILF